MQPLATIVTALREGGVAVVPTETSYALAARVALDPASHAACGRVAALKNRPVDKAFPVVASPEQLQSIVAHGWASRLERLVAAGYWPGPLSVAVAARAGLPPHVVDNGRVAVRIPDSAPLTALCAEVRTPLTATSANLSGEPPIVAAPDAARLFATLPLLDTGTLPGGAPSTVVSITETFEITLVREGAVPWSRAKNIVEVLRG